MRKIFIILCCFGILSAHATEMCARNDTVVIPLDATINGKSRGWSLTEMLWWVNYDYGTLYGAITCLSKKEIMMYSDWNGTTGLSDGFALNTSDDELIGASGYYMNADTNPDIPDEEKGDYARYFTFIKLMHPMSSAWIYDWVSAINVDNCITRGMGQMVDAGFLSTYGSTNPTDMARSKAFNSIGTVPPWEEE